MSILNHFRPTAIVGLLINSINCAKIANAVKNRDWGAVEKLDKLHERRESSKK